MLPEAASLLVKMRRDEGGLQGQLQALSFKLQGKQTPFATDQHGLGEEGATN